MTEDALEEVMEFYKKDKSDKDVVTEFILPTNRNALSAALDEIHENEENPARNTLCDLHFNLLLEAGFEAIAIYLKLK